MYLKSAVLSEPKKSSVFNLAVLLRFACFYTAIAFVACTGYSLDCE